MSDVFKQLSDAMAETVESLSPSIVRVDGRKRLPATGMVWSADGLIVTAHHVVESDENITVGLDDGSEHSATLVGRDPHNDVAVLKVDGTFTPAEWGDNDSLKIGNLILALGRPGEQLQATLGVVSALVDGSAHGVGGRRMRMRRGRPGGGGPKRKRMKMRMGRALVDGYIQTDVVMYPGFSGGPLVSGDGKVHGLNTSGFSRGISLTVPVSTIRNSVETLQTHGRIRQGYLGVGVQPARLPEDVAKELEQESGLLVVSVEKESPAATSGIFVGDIIVALDEENVEQLDDLLALLSGERVGKDVPIQIVRGGASQDLSITIAERM